MTIEKQMGYIERLGIEAEKAARAGDHQTHTALHHVEITLRELRLHLLEAEKVVKGDEAVAALRLVIARLDTA